MKIRTDFVTNSSSSCYLVTLRIVDKNDTELELGGTIAEEAQGYLNADGSVDPRDIGKAGTIDELKQMLSSFKTLTDKSFDCSDYSLLPENDDTDDEDEDEDDWDCDYSGDDEYEKFIQTVDSLLKSPDDIKSVSVSCEGEEDAYDLKAKVFEKYDYDRASGEFKFYQEATENGEDITDEMLNNNYNVDCGDGVLEFQLVLEK